MESNDRSTAGRKELARASYRSRTKFEVVNFKLIINYAHDWKKRGGKFAVTLRMDRFFASRCAITDRSLCQILNTFGPRSAK